MITLITNEEALNTLIAGPNVNTNLISDRYHTFGELYDHRIALYIALCYEKQLAVDPDDYPVWRSKLHSDGSATEGWFVLGIFEKPGDQITYHLPMSKWDECKFAVTRERAPDWDGHTSEDVLKRLRTV